MEESIRDAQAVNNPSPEQKADYTFFDALPWLASRPGSDITNRKLRMQQDIVQGSLRSILLNAFFPVGLSQIG